LLKIFETLLRTVLGLSTSRSAISVLLWPCAISVSISRSRSVSSGKACGGAAGVGVAKKRISRTAIAGLKIASPLATALMARSTSA
jgi:hypothetical protein